MSAQSRSSRRSLAALEVNSAVEKSAEAAAPASTTTSGALGCESEALGATGEFLDGADGKRRRVTSLPTTVDDEVSSQHTGDYAQL